MSERGAEVGIVGVVEGVSERGAELGVVGVVEGVSK